jgi:hypothetical protein
VRYFLENEAGGAHPEALGDAREWIAGHLELLALGKSSAHTHFLSDGRVILVRNQPLAEGGWAEVHEDITDKCRAEAQILHLSRYDDLTANRVVLDERLRGALSRAARGERFALLFLEFDAFKAVNDSSEIGSEMTIFAKRLPPTNSSSSTSQSSILHKTRS